MREKANWMISVLLRHCVEGIMVERTWSTKAYEPFSPRRTVAIRGFETDTNVDLGST